MLPLLLALSARADCPVDDAHPIRANNVAVAVGSTRYVLAAADDRARLAEVLSDCNVGMAPDHLAAFAEAREKVLLRGAVGVVVWPVALFAIGPAVAMVEARADLVAVVNGY